MSEDWIETNLGEITHFASGYSFPVAQQGKPSGVFPFIKVSDMNAPGSERVVRSAANWVNSDDLRTLRAKTYPPGTVIFPKVGAALLTEKRRILGVEATFDNNVMGLIASDQVLPEYLYALLCQVRFAEFAQQGAVPSINQSHVRQIRVRLPSLPEQRRIVDLVGAFDAQIEALASEHHSADDLRYATLGDLESVALQSEQTTLGGLVESSGGSIKTGPFGTSLKAAEYTPDGVPVISTGEVRSGYLQVHARTPRVGGAVLKRLPMYTLRHGDIVFARKGAVDRSAWVRAEEDGYFLGSDGLRVRLGGDPEDAQFVAYLLQTDAVLKWLGLHATGTIMKGLNQKILARIPLGFPPREVRQDFAERMRVVDRLRRSLATEGVALRDLRVRMLAGLLSGDVVIPASYDAVLAGGV